MPHIKPEPGIALHHHITAALRGAITNGCYQPGDFLATEAGLMCSFGVSRGTVRRALLTLAQQGWIERLHGRGTRVSARIGEKIGTIEGRLRDAREVLAGSAMRVISIDRLYDTVGAPELVRVVRLRSRVDHALWLTTATLPVSIADKFTADDYSRCTMVELLEAAGCRVVRTGEDVGAVLAFPEAAAILNVAVGSALIDYRRDLFDIDGELLCTHRNLIPPDRHRIKLSLVAEDSDAFDDDEALGGREYWRRPSRH